MLNKWFLKGEKWVENKIDMVNSTGNMFTCHVCIIDV